MHFLSPSLRHLLPTLLVSSLVSASPTPTPPGPKGTPSCDLSSTKFLRRGSPPELSSPYPDQDLKHVVLGLGTQNYTCQTGPDDDGDGDAAHHTPDAVGALAQLFDISCLVSHEPQRLTSTVQSALNDAKDPSDATERVRDELNDPLYPVGVHYFNADGKPFFDLRINGGSDYAVVQTLESVPPAPFPGANNNTVDWLKLGHKDGAEGSGIQLVYRLETFGGKASDTCEGVGSSVQIPYAAQYWFYG